MLLLEADPCALATLGDAPAPDLTPLTADAYLQQVRVNAPGMVTTSVKGPLIECGDCRESVSLGTGGRFQALAMVLSTH